MDKKKVILIRKQSTPFLVNFPEDGRTIKYQWRGTVGTKLDEKAVPFAVYDWLANYTTTFTDGVLVVKETKDVDVNDIKENIDNIEQIEKTVLTTKEIKDIIFKGNQHALKTKLNDLIQDQPEEAISSLKRNVINVAGEVGIDSSAKQKVLAEWAGITLENADLIFNKELKDTYK